MKKHRSRTKPNEVLSQEFSRVKRYSIRTEANKMPFRGDDAIIIYLN